MLKNNYSKNKITKILSKKLYINLLNVKDILEAVNLIINKKINPGNYVLKNKYNFSLQKIVSEINYNNKKKIKIKWISSKIIKEKFYKYKKPFYGINCGTIGFLMNKLFFTNLENRIKQTKSFIINP